MFFSDIKKDNFVIQHPQVFLAPFAYAQKCFTESDQIMAAKIIMTTSGRLVVIGVLCFKNNVPMGNLIKSASENQKVSIALLVYIVNFHQLRLSEISFDA